MSPRWVVLDPIGRIRRHEDRRRTVEQTSDVTRGRRIPAEQPVATEDEQFTADDVRGSRFHDRVLVREARRRLSKERSEFRVRPERRHVHAVVSEAPEHFDIPLEIEFTDAVVRDRKRLRSRIGGEIEIGALDRDETLPDGLHDTEGNIEQLGVFDGLVPRDHRPTFIDDHRACGSKVTERLFEGRPTAISAAVGVVGIRTKITDPEGTSHRSRRFGHGCASSLKKVGLGIREETPQVQQQAGETKNYQPVAKELHRALLTTSRRTYKNADSKKGNETSCCSCSSFEPALGRDQRR
jgi:hypothetical protein